MIAVIGKMFSSIATKTKKGELEKNISVFVCSKNQIQKQYYNQVFPVTHFFPTLDWLKSDLRQNAIFSRENPILESIIREAVKYYLADFFC